MKCIFSGVVPQLCNVYGGYLSFNNKCYYYKTSQWSWNAAEDFCQNIGGHLVSIESKEEADFIATYMVTYPYTHMIGFTDQVRKCC